MAKKREKLFSKIVMIIFLVMIVIGFTVPSFLNNAPPVETPQAEERLCQTDSDCYLDCGNPTAVLCYQNICQRNSCEEIEYYGFSTEPLSFTLQVQAGNQTLHLPSRQKEQDFFVAFGEEVSVFSPDLSLRHILDKAGITIAPPCLLVDQQEYCQELSMVVNGNETLAYGNYRPSAGDSIMITANP